MSLNNQNIIGILGGMGPYAGMDLLKKVFANTIASKDQEHLPVMLASLPSEIGDRTGFLLTQQSENPGYTMAKLMLLLEKSGATHCAVPCNTAHSKAIWSVMLSELEKENSKITLVHILEELKKELLLHYVPKKLNKPLRIGLLATVGTIQTGLYEDFFNGADFEVVYPSEKGKKACMEAIYNIKACSDPIRDEAKQLLHTAMLDLKEKDVDIFILGCTELPLALTEKEYLGIPSVDPVTIQARALIRATYPEKLVN